jgi:photosystem II stability/assembly factor-like uncharacterized protein
MRAAGKAFDRAPGHAPRTPRTILILLLVSASTHAAWPNDKGWIEDPPAAVPGSANWLGIAMSSDGSKRTVVTTNPSRIFASGDFGATWAQVTSSAFATGFNLYDVAMSSSGAVQVVWGGSNAGICTSADTGATWTYREPTGSTMSWRAVGVSGDGTHMTAAAYTAAQLYVSTDSGETWTARGPSKRWRNIAMSSDGSKQTATSYAASLEADSIFTSSDSGVTWTEVMGRASHSAHLPSMGAQRQPLVH